MSNITGTSYFFDRARTRMGALERGAEQLQEQIATGKRLTTASQDAAAWQRLQGLIQVQADTRSFSGNIEVARSVLATTDTTLGNITTGLQRAHELALRAASGSLSPSDRAIIAEEMSAIVADLDELADTKDARGLPLFDDSAAAIPVADGVNVVTNESEGRVFGTIRATLSSYVTTLRTGDNAAGLAASQTAIAALTSASANVASIHGSIGARAARVEIVAAAAADSAEVIAVERKGIEATDLTATIADLQKTMTVLEATQASFSKLTQLSIFNYLR